jgi:hypothetical protein
MSTPRLSVIVRSCALALVAIVSSACTVITGPDGEWGREERDLSRARSTWSRNYVDDYEYVVRRECYCTLGGVAVRVVVDNGRVVAREIDGSGVPVPFTVAWAYPTIDGLFDFVADAIDARADDISTRYDAAYGFPTDIWVDFDTRRADDEEGYTLLAFRSLR